MAESVALITCRARLIWLTSCHLPGQTDMTENHATSSVKDWCMSMKSCHLPSQTDMSEKRYRAARPGGSVVPVYGHNITKRDVT
eukprot:g3238.t1